MARKSLFCEVIGEVRARASEPRGTITDELRDVVGPRSAHHESTRVRERDEDLERVCRVLRDASTYFAEGEVARDGGYSDVWICARWTVIEVNGRAGLESVR